MATAIQMIKIPTAIPPIGFLYGVREDFSLYMIFPPSGLFEALITIRRIEKLSYLEDKMLVLQRYHISRRPITGLSQFIVLPCTSFSQRTAR